MASVWWYIKWLVIGVLTGLFCFFLYTMFIEKEGFQTMSNIQYQFKEVFLVAPTDISQSGNAVATFAMTSNSQYRTQGYTWTEARGICRGYGGDLATIAQVQNAYDNSGNWCPAGWVLDSPQNSAVYFLPTKKNTCGSTTITATVPSMTPVSDTTGAKKAFAICYAVKPPNPSISVHTFNAIDYSIVSTTLLSNIMNGTGADIFPIQFTPSQAYYAINQVGVDSVTKIYNNTRIREWLIANYDTIDASILQSQGYTDDPSQWSSLAQVNMQSCTLVKNQDDLISGKILEIKKAFQDVSGYVIASIKSKAENVAIQSLLFSICSKTTPIESPACAKLATLDFDVFYTNPVYNTLADLQMLNTEIYMRRDEICRILYNVRVLKSILRCNYTPIVAECSKGCNITSTSLDCSGSDIFDINNIGELTYSLQEISPLFDVPTYNSILASVISSLSYIIETPNLVNLVDSTQSLNLINTAIKGIQQLITNDSISSHA